VSAAVVAIEGTNIAMAGGAFHDGFSDFVANEHINHTSVTLTAGTGLTGGGDISASRTFAVDGVLEDLDTLGAASSDGEFIVATGAGVFAYEATTTARTSLGVGEGDSPTFANISLGTGELTCGSINRATGTLTIEIGGTAEQSITSTETTLGGNLIMPNGGAIGQAAGPVLTFDDTSNYLEITGCNVGIGTNTPLSSLQVTGTPDTTPDSTGLHLGLTAGNYAVMEMANSVGAYIDFTVGDTTDYKGRILYLHSNNTMQFHTNGGQKMVLDGTGQLGLNTTTPDTLLQVVGTAGFGDDAGNEVLIEADGDVSLVGGAGFVSGSFWGNEIAFVTAGGTGTYSDVTDADITAGQTHNTTFQNNQELDIGAYAGMYLVNWSMSVKGTGANKHIVGGIGVDAGGTGTLVIQNDGRNHAMSVGTGEFGISGTAILDLSANSEVGLMVTNETDNTNVTVEHVSLSIVQIGGT
jgi:hypothetical protein